MKTFSLKSKIGTIPINYQEKITHHLNKTALTYCFFFIKKIYFSKKKLCNFLFLSVYKKNNVSNLTHIDYIYCPKDFP